MHALNVMPIGLQQAMPIAIRNASSSKVVYSSPRALGEAVEWEPFGDASGRDVQQVPAEWTKSVPFLRAVATGILEVVGEDELADSVRRLSESHRAQKQADQEAMEELIHHAGGEIVISEKDITERIVAMTRQDPGAMSPLPQPTPGVPMQGTVPMMPSGMPGAAPNV